MIIVFDTVFWLQKGHLASGILKNFVGYLVYDAALNGLSQEINSAFHGRSEVEMFSCK